MRILHQEYKEMASKPTAHQKEGSSTVLGADVGLFLIRAAYSAVTFRNRPFGDRPVLQERLNSTEGTGWHQGNLPILGTHAPNGFKLAPLAALYLLEHQIPTVILIFRNRKVGGVPCLHL